ncbi:MAG: hypothetical protein IJL70_06175 [Treponema sp.]|nr:hypothetical protein [Treponema sp.]
MTRVCTGCGRNIDKEFVYCPWCGEQRVFHDQEYFDMIYERYSVNHNEQRNKQLNAVKERLEELEQELNVLVLSAEMHK